MSPSKPPTFPPTVRVWPAEPPDIPQVVRLPTTELVDEQGRWQTWPLHEAVDLPEDFVLQEVLELDPEDDDAVVRFIRAWGSLTPLDGRRDDPLTALPPLAIVDDLLVDPAAKALVRAIKVNRTLAAERIHARFLRASARHYWAHVTLGDVSEAWRAEGFRDLDPHEAYVVLARVLDAALRRFHMHVRIAFGDEEAQQQPLGTASTYEAAMLQLALMLAQERPVLACANERCGKPFTRQRAGQRRYAGQEHATGIRYCSFNCRKAQGERERRRRQSRKGDESQ